VNAVGRTFLSVQSERRGKRPRKKRPLDRRFSSVPLLSHRTGKNAYPTITHRTATCHRDPVNVYCRAGAMCYGVSR